MKNYRAQKQLGRELTVDGICTVLNHKRATLHTCSMENLPKKDRADLVLVDAYENKKCDFRRADKIVLYRQDHLI